MRTGLVKICGLKDPGNILEVINLKPDLIGFLFYPKSPRYVSDVLSLEFLNNIPGRPLTVGVFVNPDINDILKITKTLRLDVIQLHGDESPEFCSIIRNQKHAVIKAFGIHAGFDFGQTERFRHFVDYFLFDTGGRKPGGSGEQFDWALLDLYHGETPYFLSGGISPDTHIFPDYPQMAGLDLNSRFETAPGMKNTGLLQHFLALYRNHPPVSSSL